MTSKALNEADTTSDQRPLTFLQAHLIKVQKPDMVKERGEREDFLNTINLGYDILSFPKPVKKLRIEMKQMRERNMEDILLSRRGNAETARELSGEIIYTSNRRRK